MHNRGADETLIAARRERVAAAYLSGKTQWQIAHDETLDQATISRDLAALRQLWLASAVRDFGERQAEELAKVDRLEAEAWEAWERSKRPAETTTAEQTTAGEEKRTKASKRLEQRDGNPAFLATIDRCIERRCAILGVEAPKRVDVNPVGPDLSRVPTHELDRVIAAFAPAFAGLLPPLGGAGAGAPPAPG